jgi:hypothetical protein
VEEIREAKEVVGLNRSQQDQMIGGETGGTYAQIDMFTALSSPRQEREYEVLLMLMASELKQRNETVTGSRLGSSNESYEGP